MNKQQLASKIWAAANEMRSKIEASEYKDYILGFIFYKFLSEKEEKYILEELGATEEEFKDITEDSEEVKTIQKNIGYFIEYKNLFSTWIKKGSDFTIADVTDAISAFNRLVYKDSKKVFDDIFKTLETGLSKLGENDSSRTKAVKDLIHLIKIIPMDNKQDYDVLGFIYEYLISNFAANAGKKAGEFYTPHEVSLLMSEIIAYHLRDCEEIKIYDPTSGSGSLLINIGQSVEKNLIKKNKIKYYAQEFMPNTYNLTRMNLVMRDIPVENIITRCGDTLADDWPYFDDKDKEHTYEPLTNLDAVVSNPPYSQKWHPEEKQHDPRFNNYGLAPKTKADYAFLLHDLYHLRDGGIMTIVLPHGVLFRGGEEEKIRTNLIENNNIDAIIGLPANIFFGTGIPTIVMVLKKGRKNNDVLIVDASKGFKKEGKNNRLQASDIRKIVDTYIKRENVEKYSRVVSREEIRENGYNLNIPRYVDSSEKAENWDIYSSIYGGIPTSEIEELNEYWTAFPSLKNQIFKVGDIPFAELNTEDVSKTIKENADIVKFENDFKSKFANFEQYLRQELIENAENIKIAAEEQQISLEIFERLEGMPLIDKYKAYQLLDDNWNLISNDLEIIQTEGFNSTKQVDPNMVIKKKGDKEVEIQEGYVGHIITFDVVQSTLLKDEKESLKSKENELTSITEEYAEIADNLEEDNKEEDYFDKDKNCFVNAEVLKEVKRINKEMKKSKIEVDSIEEKLIKVASLIEREKQLKKDVKDLSAELANKSKETIENLTDEQVKELLAVKWIVPVTSSIANLTNTIVEELVSKVKKLSEKYKTTYENIEDEISKSASELSALIDELVGDEYDMKGLSELKSLLNGGDNDRK